jgi:hypothetical protein
MKASIIGGWNRILKAKRRAAELTRSGPRYRPVFVLAQHRSGGTLLARLLNCHDKLVVWGEHGGFLDGMAESRGQLEHWAEQLPPRSTHELRQYVGSGRLADVEFRPWMSPFSPSDYTEECRRGLLALFTRGLRRDQRWGFKEIRYHKPHLIKFLHELFPRGQFVLLERNAAGLCVSSMLAPWTRKELLAEGLGHDRRAFLQKVRSHLQHILTMRRDWAEGLAAVGAESIAMHYEDIVADMPGQMDRLFNFLNLPVNEDIRARMQISIGSVASTPKETAVPAGDLGYLTPWKIREAVERMLPEVEAELAPKNDDQLMLQQA